MDNLTAAGKILWETVTGTVSDVADIPAKIYNKTADVGGAVSDGVIATAKAAPAAVQDISSGASKGLQFGLIFALAIAAYYIFKR